MSDRPIHFYFDFISAYAYLASLRIDEIAARHGRDVEWHSMLLGVAVLKVMGLKPLLETPIKGDYVRIDVARYARRHGVALNLPPGPELIDPLPPARFFQWLKARDAARAQALAKDLLAAYWGRGIDVSSPENIAAIAGRPDLDAAAVAAAIESQEARDLLRADVAAGLDQGVFGSPFVLVDGEPFWGVDKFELIDDWLRKGGW
jgi:2-hydroxychromene-2-carboxylate isomerase